MGLFSRKRKDPPRPFGSAVIPAAGSADRMLGQGKILAQVGGIPVLVHTLLAFERCFTVDEVVISAQENDILDIAALCKDFNLTKVSKVIKGGETRMHSVINALGELSASAELVAIHDGARPCVSPELIDAVMREAASSHAAAPGLRVVDTVKETDGQNNIIKTVDRGALVTIQTPQCFEVSLIKGALQMAVRKGWDLTDDCGAVERMGMSVKIVKGESRNMKITTPDDLLVVEALLAVGV